MNHSAFRICICTLLLACSAGYGQLEYAEQEITTLQQLMQEGELSSVQLTKFYLRRIESIEQGGPELNSIIELNPQALEIAAALEQERQEIGPRGPMHGIPVVLKANIDTADEMETTAGSLAMKGHRPPEDAFLEVMPFFGQERMLAAQEKGPLSDQAYIDALEKSKRISQAGINNALEKQNLDALIAPTRGPAWMTDNVSGDHSSGISSSSLAAISGYASITIPAGDILGLPIGVSFIGGDSAMRSLSGSPMRLSREDTDADRRHWIDASEHVLEKN